MSRRLVKIKNFRNIVSKDEEQILYLNNSLDKDKIGELIILVGENNVGKSNVLDAVNKIKPADKIDSVSLQEDIPEFIEYEDSIPEIKLVYDTKSLEYIQKADIDFGKLKTEFENKLNSYSEFVKAHEQSYNGIEHIRNYYNKLTKDEKNIKDNYIELKRLYGKIQRIFNDNFINWHNKNNINNRLERLEFVDFDDFYIFNNGKDLTEFEYRIYLDKESGLTKCSTNLTAEKRIDKIEVNGVVLDKSRIKKEFSDKYDDAYIEAMNKDPYFKRKYYDELYKLNNRLISLLSVTEENDLTAVNELKSIYCSLEDLLTSFRIEYNTLFYLDLPKLEFINLESIAYKSADCEEPLESIVKENNEEEKENYTDIIKEKYGIDFVPQIVFYKERIIKGEDLKVSADKFSQSEFFKSLLKSIKKHDYIDKISSSGNYQNKRIDYEKDINGRLKEIVNKKFNELYFTVSETSNTQTQEYKFEIRLENNLIQLFMQKNGTIINLNNQSIGFKWFFNFFFNFLYANELKHGDIVLMDEPGIHLSMPGKRDLRKFIKKFARETGITFICTTHNPSFIDIDYLDELRIIRYKKDGIGSYIQNDFSAMEEKTEVDVLNEIINGFGILHRDVITNPNNTVIYVEGITDYNYLTAFKKLYEYKQNSSTNLVFLPINGLGGNDYVMNEKLSKLTKFRDAIILVDSDYRANRFESLAKNKKEVKNKLTVMQLKDIDESFEEIEDLFSVKDRNRYKHMINKKSGCQSALFKNTIYNNELEQETIDNFYKVFNNIKYE